MPTSRTLRRLTIAAALPMALSTVSCITIRTPRTTEHAPSSAGGAAYDTVGGRVTLRLRDGSTVDFPDGVIVRRDSIVAWAPAPERKSAARSALDLLDARPRPVRLPSTPRSRAGRRVAAGATRPEFVAGAVTDSVVTMRSVERRVNLPLTMLATGAVAVVVVAALAFSFAASQGQQD